MFGDSSERRSRADDGPRLTPAPPSGHGPKAQPTLPLVEQPRTLGDAERTCPQCGGRLAELTGQTECRSMLDLIGQLYAVEREVAPLAAMSGENEVMRGELLARRRRLRDERSRSIVGEIQTWALAQRSAPSSWRGIVVVGSPAPMRRSPSLAASSISSPSRGRSPSSVSRKRHRCHYVSPPTASPGTGRCRGRIPHLNDWSERSIDCSRPSAGPAFFPRALGCRQSMWVSGPRAAHGPPHQRGRTACDAGTRLRAQFVSPPGSTSRLELEIASESPTTWPKAA